MRIFSTLKSALVTKSEGPLTEICKFSISPKSLINDFDAFSVAFIMTLRLAEIVFIKPILF